MKKNYFYLPRLRQTCALLAAVLVATALSAPRNDGACADTTKPPTPAGDNIPIPSRTRHPRLLTNHLGMRFVYIKPGTFMMGSPPSERGRKPDEQQHAVTITRGFYLQTTEVTQKQWKALMGPDHIPYFDDCGDECPVDRISWEDAVAFIERLNAREKTDKYRLPTEAEWEYACRAGTGTAFFTGENTRTECVLDPVADRAGWYCANAQGSIHPVARKQPNAWGLYDMHGNLYEWCRDWYGDYPEGPATDPAGPPDGETRVFRGGAWMYLVWHARSAHRRRHEPYFRNKYTGFRVAKTP